MADGSRRDPYGSVRTRQGRVLKLVVLLIIGFILTGCGRSRIPNRSTLILATTTSVKDTGLLDELLPLFEKKYRIVVKPIAVGTGEAILMGRRGDADILLVHAPHLEEKFIREGYGLLRTGIMHNDFIIVGPPTDPAKIRESKSAAQAFKKISLSKEFFVSRGDNSGTHQKEMELWREARAKPRGQSYLQTGRGMGESLRVANEREAYILTDRATYLTLKSGLNLAVLVAGDEALLNPYSLIVVNPRKFPQVNLEGGQKFQQFLLSGEAKKIISNFGKENYGQPLFFLE